MFRSVATLSGLVLVVGCIDGNTKGGSEETECEVSWQLIEDHDPILAVCALIRGEPEPTGVVFDIPCGKDPTVTDPRTELAANVSYENDEETLAQVADPAGLCTEAHGFGVWEAVLELEEGATCDLYSLGSYNYVMVDSGGFPYLWDEDGLPCPYTIEYTN